MNDPTERSISRRQMLKCAVAVGGLAVVASRGAHAQSKVTKEMMKYQTQPHEKQECDNCVQFVPGASSSANGTCKVVDGDISPHAWCVAYAPKAA